MVDTIVFSLYIGNFPSETRDNIIRNWKKKASYGIENAKAIMNQNIEMNFTKKFMEFDINVPSSHYKIHASLDDLRGEIKFNFSVPKFYYGHNLMPSYYHAHFNQSAEYHQIPSNRLIMVNYKMLLNAMYEACNYLTSEPIPVRILMKNIKIFRVDICKNYLLESKEHVMEYIDELRKLKVPYKSLYSPRLYKSSILHVFDNYSIKAYQKSEENAEQISKLRMWTKEERAGLMQIAERTLRMEVTIRTQKLKDLFLDTFRKDDKLFIGAPDEIKAKFKCRNLTIQERRTPYFDYTDNAEYCQFFRFGKPNKKFTPDSFYEPIFDIETFHRMIQFAEEKFRFMQITGIASFIELKKQLDRGNNYLEFIGEKKMKVQPILKMFKLLENNSFAQLEQSKAICKQTKYNFLKKCKRLGIDLKYTSFRSNVENTDPTGEKFMEEINQHADKCINLTNYPLIYNFGS